MVGYSRAEVIQKPWTTEFLHGEHTSLESFLRIQQGLLSLEEFQVDIVYYKKNGKYVVSCGNFITYNVEPVLVS